MINIRINKKRRPIRTGVLLYRLWLCLWSNRDVRLVVNLLLEGNYTVNKCVECVIFAHTYVLTCIVNCTSLTDQNVTSLGNLATEQFDT